MVPPSVSPQPRRTLGDHARLALLHLLRLDGPVDRAATAVDSALRTAGTATRQAGRSVSDRLKRGSQLQRIPRRPTPPPRSAARTPSASGTTPAPPPLFPRYAPPARPVGSALYHHTAHPHTPQDVNRLHHAQHAAAGINTRIAVWLTKYVGMMQTAYVFAAIGVGSLVGVFTGNVFLAALFGSISSYFLQLVLLPILSVGQNVLGQHAELQSGETYRNTVRLNHELRELAEHLSVQDDVAIELRALLRALATDAPNPLRASGGADGDGGSGSGLGDGAANDAPDSASAFAALHTAITDGMAQAETEPVPVVHVAPTSAATPALPSPARTRKRRRGGKREAPGTTPSVSVAPTPPAPRRALPVRRASAPVNPDLDDDGADEQEKESNPSW